MVGPDHYLPAALGPRRQAGLGRRVVDGSELSTWGIGGEVNGFEPLGPGVAIGAQLLREHHIFLAGADGDGIKLGAVTSPDPSGGQLCQDGGVIALPDTAGLHPLAFISLAPGRLGLVLDGFVDVGGAPTSVLVVDVSDPSAPSLASERVELPGLTSAPEKATLDDDNLAVHVGGELYLYRYLRPWTWGFQAVLGERSGAVPTAAVRSGDLLFVGYNDGSLVELLLRRHPRACRRRLRRADLGPRLHPQGPAGGVVLGRRCAPL